MQIGILNDHHRSLFKRFILKRNMNFDDSDSVLNPADCVEHHLSGASCIFICGGYD